MTHLLDLSNIYESDMSEALGHRPVKFSPVVSEHTGSHLTEMDLSSHSGTHMDAPVHFIQGGKTIDSFPLDYFSGIAYVLPVDAHDLQEIGMEIFNGHEKQLEKTDILLISTGWEKKWKEEDYTWKYPFLTKEAAEKIVDMGFRFIGVDLISVDPSKRSGKRNGSPAHEMLLSHEVLIIENLTNLMGIRNEFVKIYAFPLKIRGCDGAPVRVVAEKL